ncbi:hypothetical protein P7C73_g1921, partial [Tremellales sp. Uapishka_1]
MIKFFGYKGNQGFDTYVNNTNKSWWKDPGLRLSVFSITIVYATQAMSGYDKSLNSTLQSLPDWKAIMGHPNASNLGLITTSLYISGFFAAVPSQMLMDKFGRRWGIFAGMIFLLVAVAIQTAAQNKAMFIAGRVVLGIGLAMSATAGPVLCQELAHPRMRGTVAAMFNTSFYVGAIAVSWIGFGVSHWKTSGWSWRLPTLFQALPALYILFCFPFLPESPRWLVANGREAQALQILAKYHANGDENDELVQFEFNEMKAILHKEQAAEAISWRKALSTTGNRKRFATITAVSIFSNWNGQAIVTYYLPRVLTLVGIVSPTQQTGINGGLQIMNYITSVVGASLAESVGRRKLWLSSFGIMLVANVVLTATSATYAKAPTAGVGGGVIFAVFLYDLGYNVACNPLLYAYETEIMPFALRAKGLAWSVTFGQLQAIIFQYCNPIGLAALKWKYYLVFTAFLVVEITCIYLFFIETSGRTLEEVSALFDGEDAVENIEAAGEHVMQVEGDEKHSADKADEETDKVAGVTRVLAA